MKYRMTLTAGQLQLREEPPAFHIRKAGDLPKKEDVEWLKQI